MSWKQSLLQRLYFYDQANDLDLKTIHARYILINYQSFIANINIGQDGKDAVKVVKQWYKENGPYPAL